MSTFTSFAIAGVGSIGAYIAEELLKLKASGKVKEVILLTRAGSTNANTDKLVEKGAKLATIDYSSQDSLTAALSGVDVVISTLSIPALAAQDAVAVAAKAAGVRLFVPSEFGGRSDEITEGLLLPKKRFHARLQEIGLPYVLVYTGGFSDLIFNSLLKLDLKSGKVSTGGDGSSPVSYTSRPDIGRFLAYVLTTLPPDQLNNKILRIEGERLSFSEVFKQYEAKTGTKLDITYLPIADLEAAIKANPADFVSLLQLGWAQGGGLVGKKEDLSNGLYPEWNPKKVIEVIAP
ncbi:NAD-P-binding protein [Dentipellis sp. KUC8613]|nr:NAD-P-binding protein [Dentipellis sp. KUC8613]